MTFRITMETEVGSPQAYVWAGVTRMSGVNAELLPYIRMTVPSAFAGQTIKDAPIGEVVFRSWLLAFGFLPFDLHALRLVSVDEAAFVECSSSWMQKVWRHERSVESAGPGRARVRDQLEITPRHAFSQPLAKAIVGFLFRHRHRKLKQIYGQ